MFPVRDDNPHHGAPLATYAIIGVNVAVFLVEAQLPEDAVESFFSRWAFIPGRTTPDGVAPWQQQLLTAFTAMFLHGGIGHLVGNMWSLWIFGDNVEERMGRGRYVTFYLLTGIAAGVAHWAMDPSSMIPTVGASGAISGVMGAYILMYPRAQIVMFFPVFLIPYFFRISAWIYLGLWFGGQLLSSAAMLGRPVADGGVAFGAHVGGFVAGVVLHRFFLLPARRPMQPDEYGLEQAWRRGGGARRRRWN